MTEGANAASERGKGSAGGKSEWRIAASPDLSKAAVIATLKNDRIQLQKSRHNDIRACRYRYFGSICGLFSRTAGRSIVMAEDS